MFLKYLYTFKTLLSAPRNVVDSFLSEEKLKYTHPFLFAALGVVLLVILNTLFVDYTIVPEPLDLGTDVEAEHLQEMSKWMQIAAVRSATQFLPIMMLLLLVPMLSLAGLFFLKEKITGFYNNLILNCYAVGASMISLIVMIPIWIFSGIPLTDPSVNVTMPAVLYSVFMLWIYQNYLMPDSVMDWIRLLSSYLTGFVLFVFMNNFIAGVIGYVIFVVLRIAELAGS